MRTLVVLMVVAGLVAPAGAASLRKQCKQGCAAAIEACIAGGTKKGRCKRTVQKECRKQGIARCSTTTTSSSSSSSTSSSSTTSSTATTSTSTSATSTTSAGASTTTTTQPTVLNGCDSLDDQQIMDLTGQTLVTVAFDFAFYSPSCFKVSAETMVKFTGTFSAHPLVGGTVFLNSTREEPTSPIQRTMTGTEQTFTLATPGFYGFFCDVHGLANGMKGAVLVVP